MKRILSYPELWKQKRKELPVKGNPDAGWQQLRIALDNRLPAPAVTKKPSHFKMPKWGLKVLIGLSSMAAIYAGSRLYLSKKQPDTAIPNTRQSRRDALTPAANHTAPALVIVKPVTGGGTSEVVPVIAVPGPRFNHQTKPDNGSTIKPGQRTTDSIKAEAILNITSRSDSIKAPMEALPKQSLRDSAGAVDIGKKDSGKDTSGTAKKTSKKKRRSKFSVSF